MKRVEADKAARPTRGGTVVDKLRLEVLAGEYAPGTRLRQVNIAERYGVSTTPVREAFAMLAQEGLVVKDSRRGVIVFNPTPEELREIYKIRLVLEPLATELASPQIADVDLDELETIIVTMRASSDGAERAQLNRRLHSEIYGHAGMRRLSAIIDQLRDAANVYLRLTSNTGDDPAYWREGDDEHQTIIDALRRRDGAGAAEAMREHLMHSQHHIESTILAPGGSER